jgi:hypothetical protein
MTIHAISTPGWSAAQPDRAGNQSGTAVSARQPSTECPSRPAPAGATGLASDRLRRLPVEDVAGLVKRDTVDLHKPGRQLDEVASHSDDALDERRVALTGAGGRVKDHDLAAGVTLEPRGELVDQHHLPVLEGVLHADLHHPIGLHHVPLDNQKDDNRQGDRLRNLEQVPKGFAVHRRPEYRCRGGPRTVLRLRGVASCPRPGSDCIYAGAPARLTPIFQPCYTPAACRFEKQPRNPGALSMSARAVGRIRCSRQGGRPQGGSTAMRLSPSRGMTCPDTGAIRGG